MKSRSRHKSSVRRFLGILFLCSLILCLCLGQSAQIVTAQSTDAPQLVQQGIERYKAGDFRGAIAPWQTALKFYQNHNRANAAIVSENLARAYQQLGESKEALSYWDKVIAYYQASKDWKQMGRMLTEAAQTYSNFGQPGKAIALLCNDEKPKPKEKRVCRLGSALQIALEQKDKSAEVAALGSLGEAYRLSGDYEQAIKDLEQAKEIKDPAYQFSVLNSLGNAHLSIGQIESIHANSAFHLGIRKASEFEQNARKNYESAQEYFQSSLQLAREQDNKPGQMQALLNVIRLDSLEQVDRGKNNSTAAGGTSERFASVKPVAFLQSEAIVQEALALLDKLPNSQNKIYAAIDLANLPINSVNITSPLTQCFATQRRLPDSQAQELLQQAVKTAQNLQSARSESFALGALGHFYECRQEYKQALEFTQKALLAADQKLNDKDGVYLWEWQAGRILQAQGKEAEALPAYERAFTTLEKIRSDILIANRDLQFDFRDIIRPLYVNFAQLRLEQAPPPSVDNKKRKQELKETLKTIDALKLAELQNFFGNNCILTAINDKSVDELLGKDTAVISFIILDRGVAILLSLPNNETRFEWIKENTGSIIKPETFIKEIAEFREGLVHGRPAINYDTQLAGKLYDKIIRPFEKDLNPEQIQGKRISNPIDTVVLGFTQ
ncbi:MAG: tetratricopeptide repeat protein, partial [Rhizonema sp. PD38]|nr:tetratricopeptide repeat protein [Rhizonema sp. PD38]